MREAAWAGEPILSLTRTGVVLDTLASIDARNRMFRVRAGSAVGFVPQPFSDAGLAIPDPANSRVFLVDRSVAARSEGASFRVSAVDADGDTAWSRRISYVPTRLDPARVDSFVTALRRSFERGGVRPDVIRREAFTPTFITPVADGIAATDGALWLRRDEHAATVEYWIIRRAGGIAAVRVPRSHTVLAASQTHAWAVVVDEYGVPTIVRYRIHKT